MRRLSTTGRHLATGCLLALLALAPAASAEVIEFDGGNWVLFNADAVEHLGRPALSGSAFLPNIDFRDGVIEFDLAVDGSRGYPGITFRATSQTTFEHIYIRPHAGRRTDGLQYAPAFNGSSDWQLYNGEGYTNSLVMNRNEWVHVRVEILGQRARVFYGETDEPQLVVDELVIPAASGAIGIRSARDSSAYFSNFSVTKTDELLFDPPRRPAPPRGLVTEWEVSQSFKAVDVDADTYPGPGLQATIEWQALATETNGLLNFSRHVQRSRGETDVVFARVFLEADEAETRRFSFGYSDYATVYLNGEPVFSGNSSYLGRSREYAGIISLEDMLHLRLEKGRNELLFAVMESFGGWGVMGQDNGDDYLDPALAEAWSIDTGNRLPESVVYDAARDVLYVTQYYRAGNEYLSRLSPEGEILDREWIAGLNRPCGMVIRDDHLWVVERTGLADIDLSTGEIVARHEVEGPGFLNDIAFDAAGRAYVTDTRGGCIHRFDGENFEVWLDEGVDEPNGIFFDGDALLWGNSGDATLKRVDPETCEVSPVAVFSDDTNLDGLCRDAGGDYLVSDFAGRLFRVTAEGETTELLNTTASGAKCADLACAPEKKLIVVPGLFDNRLTAYRYDF